ncbi:MAG: NUDIX hydrolase [Gemmataceae bacterium]
MSRQLVHRGRKIEVHVDTTELPDGTTIRRDVILHPGAVVILPLVDDTHVCLLRNHRFILGETLWELPAGTLEPGEHPDSAAVRELAEETGYSAERWTKLGEGFSSPGCISERMHLYIARDLTPGPMRPENDEDLQPHAVPWDQALTWAIDGTICDLKTVAMLLWWERVRERTNAASSNSR